MHRRNKVSRKSDSWSLIYLQSRVDNRVPGTRGTWTEASDHCPLDIYSFSRSAEPAHDLLGSLDQQMEPHSLPLQMFPFDSPFPILVFTPNKTHPDSSRINTESHIFAVHLCCSSSSLCQSPAFRNTDF